MNHLSFLVVDDSEVERSLVAAVLRARLGAERIFEAADGREATLLLACVPIDVIISDREMASVTGDELLAIVRRNHKLRDIPFIMMSSNMPEWFRRMAKQLGATQCLAKPFTPAELERAVRLSQSPTLSAPGSSAA